jgi:hypothetical protein
MGATTPQTGRGTTLGVKVPPASTFATVGLCMSVEPAFDIGEVEATILSSTWKPFLATIGEGEATFNLRHATNDPQVIVLQGMLTPPVPTVHWIITFQDGGTLAFDGFIKGYKITGVENESIVDAEVPIRITTQPVFVAGT